MSNLNIKKDDIISEIIKLELEITNSITSGFVPHTGDIYQEKRIRLKLLRDLINL